MRCELLRRVRYSVVGLTHASVRVAGTARNRMPLFVRLPTSRVATREGVRACTDARRISPRPSLLAPWHARRGRRQ